MFHHRLWKACRSQASADPRLQQRPRRRPWIYGVGALIPLLISLLAFTPAFASSQWTGWFQVPTVSQPLTTVSTPAVVTYDTGKTVPGCTFLCTNVLTEYIFARQPDNTIDFSTADRSSGSQAPASTLSPVPGGGHTPNAPTAAQLGSTLYLFVQGPDNFVWVNTFNGTTWSGWHHVLTVTNDLVQTPSGPYVTIYQGALYLFARESDSTIHVTRTLDGTTWTQLSEVPSGGHTLSTPTAAVFGNTLYAMVQGPDNLVWVNTFNGVTWSGWFHLLSGGVNPIPTSTSPIAGADGANGFHLIVRLSDGSIHESATFDGITWGNLSELPSGGRTPSALAVMAIPSELSGLFVLAQGTDNIIYENDFDLVG